MTFPSFHDPNHLYFAIASIVEWKHLFTTPEYIKIPLNSLAWIQQKLEYIHQDPVGKDWRLAEDRAAYLYSTAGYYDYGRKPIIEITDINKWLTSNPSPRTAKEA